MTGRPYRVLNGRFESAAIGPLALSDDASLFALLLQHPAGIATADQSCLELPPVWPIRRCWWRRSSWPG
jgi:hypothetical protein